MLKKYENFFVFIVLFISFINSSSTFNESYSAMKNWDEETLFEYVKFKYLTPDNETNNISDFHYLLIDPNEYLKDNYLTEIKNNLEKLYKAYNITSFIYIISDVKKNTNLNYKLKDFNYKVFTEIYKYKKDFDEYSTMTAIFHIEDNKMNIRLGNSCRKIISDFEAFQILKDNSDYLSNKQIGILLNNFISSFIKKYSFNYQKYTKNTKNNFAFFKQIFTFKGISIFIVLILSYIILIYFCLIYKYTEKCTKNNINNTDLEKSLEKFIKINKDETIGKVMKNFCIICLNNYDSDSIIAENNDTEKINLPCGHSFHHQCIYKYFKSQENKLCPICKTKFKMKLDDNNEKIIIKNYDLNTNWEYNDSNSFDCIINDFISLQKTLNSFEIKNEFCDKMISLYCNQNLENSTVKIKNY